MTNERGDKMATKNAKATKEAHKATLRTARAVHDAAVHEAVMIYHKAERTYNEAKRIYNDAAWERTEAVRAADVIYAEAIKVACIAYDTLTKELADTDAAYDEEAEVEAGFLAAVAATKKDNT